MNNFCDFSAFHEFYILIICFMIFVQGSKRFDFDQQWKVVGIKFNHEKARKLH